VRLRWGPWATLAWGIPLLVTAVLSQTLGAFVFLKWWQFAHPEQPIALATAENNGAVLAFALAASAPIVLGVLALVVRSARVSVSEYLALRWPRWRDLVIGAAIIFGVLLVTGIIAGESGEQTPDFMAATYTSARSAGMLPLLIFSFVLLGPLQEELLFRGFFFRGLAPALGPWPAILLTAAVWAVTHMQYQWFFVGEIFALGVAFGWMRWRSSSTLLTFFLHAGVNGLALVEVASLVQS
jgi:hypothetical protein